MSIDRGKVDDGADKSRPALHVPCWLGDLARITAVDMKEGKKEDCNWNTCQGNPAR